MTDPNTTVIVGQYTDTVCIVGGPQHVAIVGGGQPQPDLVVVPEQQGPIGPPGKDGSDGVPGPSGPPGQVPVYIAGCDLGGHKALMFQQNGTVVYADPNAEGYLFAGVSLGAAPNGAQIQAEVIGSITEPSWSWMPLAAVYVAAPGVLTQVPPASGLFHLVAFAVTATTIFLWPTIPTILA